MADYKQILLVSNEGKGGVINHPAQFDYPEKKKMGERWFIKTDRFRTLPDGQVAAVYTQEGFKLNIDDFADLKKEDVEEPDASANTVAAFQDLDEIFGEESIFTDMVIDWHNKYLGQRLSK